MTAKSGTPSRSVLRRAYGTASFMLLAGSCVLIVIHSGSERWFPAVLLLLLSAVAGRVHFRYDRQRYAFGTPPRRDSPSLGRESLMFAKRELGERLTMSALRVYVVGAMRPHLLRMRTTERLTPQSRSLLRETTHELQLPAGASAIVPVLLLEKGYLQDFREVSDAAGKSLSVLTFFESTALALAVIERMVKSGFDRDWDPSQITAYRAHEDRILRAIGSRSLDENEAQNLTRALDGLSRLKPSSDHPSRIDEAGLLITLLHKYYAVCVELPGSASGLQIVNIRDHVIPKSNMRDPSKRSLAGLAGLIRSMTGSRPARYWVSCRLAMFARSYHLELVGPDGLYLARQRFFHPDRDVLEGAGVYDRWTSRRGQRFAHLYLRAAHRYRGEIVAQFGFIERPPGSLAFATVAAFATSSVITLAWLAPPESERYLPFLAATLLTFPAASAVIAGFNAPSNFVGVMAFSRIGVAANLAIAIGASAMIVLQPSLLAFALVASVLNTLFLAYWWLLRSALYVRLGERAAPVDRARTDLLE